MDVGRLVRRLSAGGQYLVVVVAAVVVSHTHNIAFDDSCNLSTTFGAQEFKPDSPHAQLVDC